MGQYHSNHPSSALQDILLTFQASATYRVIVMSIHRCDELNYHRGVVTGSIIQCFLTLSSKPSYLFGLVWFGFAPEAANTLSGRALNSTTSFQQTLGLFPPTVQPSRKHFNLRPERGVVCATTETYD